MVNPVETVQIGSYVSGRIQDIYCDYNSKVVKGQRCAKIDPRSYQAAVSQAAAALDTGKAQLGKDQANLDYAKGAYERAQALWSRQVASKDALQNALKTYRQTQAQIDLDKAVIGQHEAELNAAKVNLDYTNIISPVDGTVVSRNAAIGQTVTASFQTPTLFVIATDLTHMQVDTNVTEAAIGEIHEGQKVTFTVPAFPGRTFEGVVTQVRQAPVSVQNVISYDAVISVDNRDHALKPGMTATAHIVAAQHDNVLRVPERALRFTPGAPSPMTSTHDKRQHVWVLRDGKPAAVPVTTGLHDDEYVELTGDAIAANAQVIVGKARPATTVAVQP